MEEYATSKELDSKEPQGDMGTQIMENSRSSGRRKRKNQRACMDGQNNARGHVALNVLSLKSHAALISMTK